MAVIGVWIFEAVLATGFWLDDLIGDPSWNY